MENFDYPQMKDMASEYCKLSVDDFVINTKFAIYSKLNEICL